MLTDVWAGFILHQKWSGSWGRLCFLAVGSSKRSCSAEGNSKAEGTSPRRAKSHRTWAKKAEQIWWPRVLQSSGKSVVMGKGWGKAESQPRRSVPTGYVARRWCACNIAQARHKGWSSSQAKWETSWLFHQALFQQPACSQVTTTLCWSWLQCRQPNPAKEERLQSLVLCLGKLTGCFSKTNCKKFRRVFGSLKEQPHLSAHQRPHFWWNWEISGFGQWKAN